ncbi:MAG: RHS repeat protein, partial [Chloroflexi bacterium]
MLVLGLVLGSVQPVWAMARPEKVDKQSRQVDVSTAGWRRARAQAIANKQAGQPAPLADVNLALTVSQSQVQPGSQVLAILSVTNTSRTSVADLTVELFFDESQVQVVGRPAAAQVGKGLVSWHGVAVAGGATWQSELKLQLAANYSVRTELRARVRGEELYARRHARVEVRTSDPPAAQVRVQPGKSKTLTTLEGRVTLEIPAGAVPEPLTVQMRWSRPRPQDPWYIQERLELSAYNDAGQKVTQFAAPLRLIVRRNVAPAAVVLDERARRRLLTGSPTFFWLDERQHKWLPVESQYDPATETVSVSLTHFSTWGQGDAASLGEVGLPQLKVNAAGLFTGNFSFNYPLAAPPGPHGFGPKLSLTYNDEVANSAWDGDMQSGTPYRIQASTVGYGWNIGGLGSVRVNWHANPFEVYLSFAGGSYKLKYETSTGEWYTEPESFLKVWRDGTPQSTLLDELLRPDAWHVMDQNGVKYTFGNGLNPGTAYFRHDNVDSCGELPYAYYLRRVEDVNGNYWQVSYTWQEELWNENHCKNKGKTYIRATYPDKVQLYRQGYNNVIAEIRFIKEANTRNDIDIADKGAVPAKQALYAKYRIGQIQVYSRGDSGLLETFRYDLSYEYSQDYCAYRQCIHSRLTGITLTARHDPGGGHTASPRVMTFAYEHYSSGSGELDFAAQYLQRISNGRGGELLLKRTYYDISGHHRYALSASRIYDGQAYVWTTYSPSGGQYDTQGTGWPDGDDEFAGFATVEAHQHSQTSSSSEAPPAHTSEVIAKTQYSFQQGLGAWPDDVLRGELWRQSRYPDPNNVSYYHNTLQYYTAGNLGGSTTRAWPRLDREVVVLHPDGSTWDTRCTTFAYDTSLQGNNQYGRLTHKREYRDAAWNGQTGEWDCAGALYRTTMTRYAVNDNPAANPPIYMIRPSERKVYEGDVTGACKAQTRYYYDWQAWGVVAREGLLTRKSVQSQSCDNSSGWLDTDYTYWSNGNVKRVTQPPNNSQVRAWTETTWDGVHGAYAVQVTNNLGQATTTSYDLALGVALSVTDVANNVTNEFEYDGYGRLRRSWIEPQNKNNGDTRATEKIEYYEGTTVANASCSSSWCVHRMKLDEAGGDNYLHSYAFMDGLGRPIQTQSEGESQPIVRDTWYEERGQVAKESVPYFSTATFGYYHTPQAQPFTQYDYDGLGRVSVVTAPDGTQTKTYYRGYRTAVIDANDHMTMQEQDDWGRLASAWQYTGVYTDTATIWDATAYFTATYSYDTADHLTMVLDSTPITITIGYDLAGRKTSMTDPDMGTWSYSYDAAGNLTSQTDARGCVISFSYDALNRLTGKSYSGPGACGSTPAVNYSYDDTSNGNKGVGRRTGMSDGSGSTDWVYDERGRVARETKTITAAGTFTTTYGYDAMDRVKSMTYPDNEVVTYGYNAQGLAESLSSSLFGAIVMESNYNAAGQSTERRLGTGNGIWYKQLFSYDPNTFRLTALKAGNNWNGFDNLINMSYEYDAVGNVVSITDAAVSGGGQTQSFKKADGTPAYDELNRLTRAQTTGGSGGLYGPYTYAYGANGNVTSFEGKAFAYNDSAHKHALTHVDGTQKYWYDENGNMTRRIDGAGQDHTLSYDAENRLVSITQTAGGGFVASYMYDGDGKRVKEGKSDYTRYFVGDYYEKEGTIVRKYYSLGGVRVAESFNGVLYFLLTDHLGSTALTTTREGGRVGELRYYPYGVWRYKWGAPKTSYRYTGQRWDSGTGLYWYRSRWYDP